MSLNLYDILKQTLTESVDQSSVIDAIDNKYQVWVYYSDAENHAPGRRLVEPYVYGISKAGNPIIRAFVWKGDSYRGAPRWETMRLDRVTSWKPRKNNHFQTDPRSLGALVPGYNPNGDKSMTSVIKQVKFDDNVNQTSLDTVRQQSVATKNLGKVNLNKAKTDLYGNLPFNQYKKNVYSRSTKKNDMVAKDISDTQKSREEWEKIWQQVEQERNNGENEGYMDYRNGPINTDETETLNTDKNGKQ